MKKFVLLSVGYTEPTPEIGEAWGKWFERIGDRIIDGGSPFAAGKEVSKDGGVKDLPLGLDATTGYLMINAEDMDEAVKIAQDCPSITSMRVYEAAPM